MKHNYAYAHTYMFPRSVPRGARQRPAWPVGLPLPLHRRQLRLHGVRVRPPRGRGHVRRGARLSGVRSLVRPHVDR